MALDYRNPYEASLGDGLVLRTPRSGNDIERVAEFDGSIHGPLVAPFTRNLFFNRTAAEARDLIFVEDERSGEIVSSLCLIPWTWSFDGIEIPTGEMGIVGTKEAYRKRGLIRAQVDYFKQRLQERGCLLSQIQGIPHYYRQFGYEYALPLLGGRQLEFRDIPDTALEPFSFRLATANDIPVLTRLYDETAHDLAIHALRTTEVWHYLFEQSPGGETECDTWLIEDTQGNAVGYFRIPKVYFWTELVVNEVSRLSFAAALATLQKLKELAIAKSKPGIRLNIAANSTLMQLAQTLEGRALDQYKLQIYLPDVTRFIRTLAPVFECRVADSPFAGLTRVLHLGMYVETLALTFKSGMLVQVERVAPTGEEELRLPPRQFIPLILGDSGIEELRENFPDAYAEPLWRLLLGTLFPKLSAFIYPAY
jgi:GNAT superfamily N-acetyltransferase